MILMRLMIADWKRLISWGSDCVCKDAVDAIADAQAGLFRLDVNVAGPLVGRLDEDLVDELDDAGFLGHLGRFAVVGLEPFEQLDALVLGALLHEGGHGFAADAEVRLDEAERSRAGWPGPAGSAGR